MPSQLLDLSTGTHQLLQSADYDQRTVYSCQGYPEKLILLIISLQVQIEREVLEKRLRDLGKHNAAYMGVNAG